MSRTRQELVNAALENLNVLPAGATASATDASLMDSLVNGLLERLRIRTIYSAGDSNAIDDWAFDHVAVLLADAGKDKWGGGQFDVLGAESQLREMTYARPTYETFRADYF